MAVIWLPQSKDMMNATLEALRNLGGRGRKREIYEQMIKNMGFSEAQLQVLQNSKNLKKRAMPEIYFRFGWTKTYLKWCGLIENPSRGLWALSSQGQKTTTVNEDEVNRRVIQMMKEKDGFSKWPGNSLWEIPKQPALPSLKEYASPSPQPLAMPDKKYSFHKEPPGDSDDNETVLANGEAGDNSEMSWDALRKVLLKMRPLDFEQLCAKLLRKKGYTQIEVTQATRDGGVDIKAMKHSSLL